MDGVLITLNTFLLIIMVLVPGLVLKRFYYQGNFSRQFNSGTIAENIISTIFFGIFILIITLLFFNVTTTTTFTTDKDTLSIIYRDISENRLPSYDMVMLVVMLKYLFISLFSAILLGGLSHYIVRFFRLDVKYQILRFANHWHYYFKGEIIYTRDFKHINKKIVFTYVDVFFDNGDNKTLYSGIISQYTICRKTNDLEFIYLTKASRYSDKIKGFKDIPGDCFIIPFNRVLNINIRYMGENKPMVTKSRYENIYTGVSVVFFILFLVLLIVPWIYLKDVSLIRTLFGMFTSIFALFSLAGIILDIIEFFQPKELRNKDYDGIDWMLIPFLLFLLLLTMVSYKLYYPLMNYLLNL